METPNRITGVRDFLDVEGRRLTFVWRSPYRFRVFEGDHEVTKEFKDGNVRGLASDDERNAAYALCEKYSVGQSLSGVSL